MNDKRSVEEAIAVVSQAIYIFTNEKSPGKGYYPRETQLISIWLFLNPFLNRSQGRIGKIMTGEGKSIIVAAIAAIKALSCQKVDIVTSSNVLAVRDSIENKPFFEMLDLQVTNNCDLECENGNGGKSGEEVRKLRYCSEKGPVDVVYGETGCFER